MKCIRCAFEGDEKFFVKNRTHCKNCHNIGERISYQKCKQQRAQQKKEYNKTYLKQPDVIARRKAYKQTDKYRKYARNYMRVKLHNNISERLKTNIRNRIRHSVKKRNECSAELLDCPIEMLIKWLEFNFDEEMSWDNYGSYWHMDHITPCASFDMDNKEQRLKCFNWRNVAPLEGRLNESKHSKIDKKIIKYYNERLELFIEDFIN